METKTNKEFKVVLSKELSESYFYDALCNGLKQLASYRLELRYDTDEYSKIKASLKEESIENVCYEEVLMEILRKGGELTICDTEGTGFARSIKLDDVYKRVCHTPFVSLKKVMDDNGDADSYDAVLQTVFFKKILLG